MACYYRIWYKTIKNNLESRFEKINWSIYRGSLPIKLTDSFIYPINISFCVISENTFNGRGYTTLRVTLTKSIWC